MRFVSAIACLAVVQFAAAQNRSGGFSHGGFSQGGDVSHGGFTSSPGGSFPGLGGVPAQIPLIQPFGPAPAQPGFHPMPVAPWPGANATPHPHAPVASPFGSAPGAGLHTPAFSTTFNDHHLMATPSGSFTSVGFNGSGFHFNGVYANDNFRLGVHVGSDAFTRSLCRPNWCNNWCNSAVVWPYPGWWYGGYPWYDYGNHYDTVYGSYYPPDPAMNPPAPPAPVTQAVTPSTNRELADTYLHAGDVRAAIKSYQAHLKQYPGDEDAMRALGLALMENSQVTEGVAMISMAYSAEPLLADHPIPHEVFHDGAAGLARNISRASVYANRVKSASGWLAVAVLMQAQGRDELAKTMVERARGAGLQVSVADRLSSALH